MHEVNQSTVGKVPRWYRFTWFLGRAPDLTDRQWRVLGLVSAVSFFEMYDLYLFSLNLAHIQRELNIAEADLGFLGSIVRAGSLLSVLVLLAADRWGRRAMLLLTVVWYTLLTGATAFAPTAEAFVVLQFFARAFAVAEVLLAVVVIAEEFPADKRGWGIGALGAIQACGAGLAALMFSMVDVLPFGWRSLYLIGLVPLVLIAYWRRTMPETMLFKAIQESNSRQPSKESIGEPLVQLVKQYPGKLSAIGAVVFFFTLGASGAGFFAPKYLQDVHEWSPAGVAAMMAIGGAFGIIGNPMAGWLSDRFGRKPVSIIFSIAYLVVVGIFYGSVGLLVPFLWIVYLFFLMGTDVAISTYGAELFPTRSRSTATGVRGVVSTIATALGLALISVLYPIVGSNWNAILILCSVGIVVPILFYFLFPETAGKSLSEIAPDEIVNESSWPAIQQE
jgi:MFS family permease